MINKVIETLFARIPDNTNLIKDPGIAKSGAAGEYSKDEKLRMKESKGYLQKARLRLFY